MADNEQKARDLLAEADDNRKRLDRAMDVDALAWGLYGPILMHFTKNYEIGGEPQMQKSDMRDAAGCAFQAAKIFIEERERRRGL